MKFFIALSTTFILFTAASSWAKDNFEAFYHRFVNDNGAISLEDVILKTPDYIYFLDLAQNEPAFVVLSDAGPDSEKGFGLFFYAMSAFDNWKQSQEEFSWDSALAANRDQEGLFTIGILIRGVQELLIQTPMSIPLLAKLQTLLNEPPEMYGRKTIDAYKTALVSVGTPGEALQPTTRAMEQLPRFNVRSTSPTHAVVKFIVTGLTWGCNLVLGKHSQN